MSTPTLSQAEVYLESKSLSLGDDQYAIILFSMASCFTDNEMQKFRLDDIITQKAITRSNTKPTLLSLKEEIRRRYALIQVKEDQLGIAEKDKTKMARCSNCSRDRLIDWLKSHRLQDMEKRRVLGLLIKFYEYHELKLAEAKENSELRGEHVTSYHKRKMRFIEALVSDDLRDALISKNDSQDRHTLDSRNSESQRQKSLGELLCEMMNDKMFLPCTSIMADLHHSFTVSIELPYDLKEPMTPEQAMKWYNDLRGKLQVVRSKWKRSGEGKGMVDGAYRFKKTTSEDDIELDDDSDDDGDDHEYDIEYIDDDRSNYFQNDLSLGYFWGVLELYDLLPVVMQNLNQVGMSIDDNREASKEQCITNKKRSNGMEEAMVSMQSMIRENRMLSDARYHESTCLEALNQAKENENQLQETLMTAIKDLFMMKTRNESMELVSMFEDEVDKLKMKRTEAEKHTMLCKKAFEESKAEYLQLNVKANEEVAVPVTPEKTRRPRKRQRPDTPTTSNGVAILQSANHSFTAPIPAEDITNIEVQNEVGTTEEV